MNDELAAAIRGCLIATLVLILCFAAWALAIYVVTGFIDLF